MGLSDFIGDVTDQVFTSTDLLGEAVTRWPDGDSGSSETVNGCFNQQEPDRHVGSDLSRRQKGILTLAASQAVSKNDLWVIDGRTWSVETLEQNDHGIRDVHLTATDYEHRTSGGGRRL